MKTFVFKINNFDFIRLLAALQVAIVHSYEHLGVKGGEWFIHLLSIFPGVPIFFVISGFLVSKSLERTSSLATYFKNRFLRIFPALWGCFIFSVVTVFIAFSPNAHWFDFAKWTIAQITIGQVYNPDFLRGYGVGVLNGSLWTIPVELQFYLILPLLYVFLNRIKWNSIFLLMFIAGLIAANQLYIGAMSGNENITTKLFGVTVIPYLYMFLFGVLLQRNLLLVEKYLANKFYIWLCVFLLAVLISSYSNLTYKGNYLNPALGVLISFLTISMAYSHTHRLSNILKGNDISYGVYIYHMIFVNLLIHTAAFTPVVNLFIVLISTIGVALISWKVIERPSLSLKKQSLKHSSSTTVLSNKFFPKLFGSAQIVKWKKR